MTTDDIKEKIKGLLAQFIADAEVSDDQDIFASGLVNSMFAMQLVLFVEKEYQFKVENEDLDISNFRSINAIVEFVGKKLAQ